MAAPDGKGRGLLALLYPPALTPKRLVPASTWLSSSTKLCFPCLSFPPSPATRDLLPKEHPGEVTAPGLQLRQQKAVGMQHPPPTSPHPTGVGQAPAAQKTISPPLLTALRCFLLPRW